MCSLAGEGARKDDFTEAHNGAAITLWWFAVARREGRAVRIAAPHPSPHDGSRLGRRYEAEAARGRCRGRGSNCIFGSHRRQYGADWKQPIPGGLLLAAIHVDRVVGRVVIVMHLDNTRED